jgi:hypothetical protein
LKLDSCHLSSTRRVKKESWTSSIRQKPLDFDSWVVAYLRITNGSNGHQYFEGAERFSQGSSVCMFFKRLNIFIINILII